MDETTATDTDATDSAATDSAATANAADTTADRSRSRPEPPRSSAEPPPRPTAPPRGGRPATTWKVLAGLAAVIVLILGTLQVVALLAHEERTTMTTYDAGGLTTLDVDVDDGTLTVVGTDDSRGPGTITVTARISDGLQSTSERQTVAGDRLELRGRCPGFISNFCRVSYTVELPSSMAVRARSDNGDIRLTAMVGDLDLRSDNGSVSVRGSGPGLVRLGTDNGSVDATDLRAATVAATSDNGAVSLAFARSPVAVEATSDNGAVTVVVPDDGSSYSVDIASSNGSTAAPIRTDPSAARSLRARSDNGDVLVTYAPR